MASVLPSGLNATLETASLCAWRVLNSRPLENVPKLDGLVTTSGGQRLAIGTERHAGDSKFMCLEDSQLAAIGHIPKLDGTVSNSGGSVSTSGGQRLAIGTERHAGDMNVDMPGGFSTRGHRKRSKA